MFMIQDEVQGTVHPKIINICIYMLFLLTVKLFMHIQNAMFRHVAAMFMVLHLKNPFYWLCDFMTKCLVPLFPPADASYLIAYIHI